MTIVPVKVSATEDGIRLGRWAGRHYPDANMILVRRLCRSGEIRINSRRCKEGDILKAGDLVRIPPMLAAMRGAGRKAARPAGFSLSELEKLRRTIIRNDDDIVIFNKPAGLAAQGGSGVKKSLDKMAAALFPNDTVLLVHRLDKETSGIMIVAKNQMAARKMAADFQSGNVGKTYIALLSGSISPKSGTIDHPVDGKRAITDYRAVGGLKNVLTFVRFAPRTGRKHQLRVHAADVLGAPIVGDDLYGGRAAPGGGLKALLLSNHLHLFASKITFRHPRSGKTLTISAEMPEWMRGVAELCEVKC